MTINTTEDSVAGLEEWYALRDKAAEWDKPRPTFHIQVDSKDHCWPFGGQDDELQRFDELVRWAAIYLGHADLKGEAARDFLAVLLRDYFMDQISDRQKVGLVGHDKEATIEFPFKAAKIYFGYLTSDSPAQRSNDESPMKASEKQGSEITQLVTVEGIKILLKACKGVIDKETLQDKRRKVVADWLELRESITGNKATKTSLYKRADQPASEFFRWQRGELPHGSSPDIDIRSVLTEYPGWDLPDPDDREDPDDSDSDWDF